MLFGNWEIKDQVIKYNASKMCVFSIVMHYGLLRIFQKK